MKINGISGNHFMLYISGFVVPVFLSLKIVAAEKIIPKQSRKIVKPRISSKVLAQKTIKQQSDANTERDSTNTLFLADRFANAGGKYLVFAHSLHHPGVTH